MLRDLESAGYIETYEQESLYARANSLDEITDDLRTRANRFTEATEEIERRWNEPSVEQSTVSIVTRFETVIKNADEFIRDADTQVNVSLGVEHFERLRPALRAATENGVRVNLSLHTPDGSTDSLPDPEDLADVCSEARHRRLPSPFVVIVDRTRTCFAPHAGSTNEYGVLVDDRTHTYVFHWYFLTTQWDTWEPIYTSLDDEPPIDYIDIRYCVRDVAPLLRDGATVRVRIEGPTPTPAPTASSRGPSPRSSSPATTTQPQRLSRATAAGSPSWSRPTTAPSRSAAGGQWSRPWRPTESRSNRSTERISSKSDRARFRSAERPHSSEWVTASPLARSNRWTFSRSITIWMSSPSAMSVSGARLMRSCPSPRPSALASTSRSNSR